MLTDNGHEWVGIDISPAMLNVARDRQVDGDLVLGDMGMGLPFRAGTFDGAISVSAVQWLCNAGLSALSVLLACCFSWRSCIRCIDEKRFIALAFVIRLSLLLQIKPRTILASDLPSSSSRSLLC